MKIRIIISIFLCAFAFLRKRRSSRETSLLQELNAKINQIATSPPENYKHLIKELSARSNIIYDSVQHSELENTLKTKHNLPKSVIEKFKGIAFSKTVTIQSFNLSLTKNQGSLNEYIGVAYNDKNFIRLAYAEVESFGTLIPAITKDNTCFDKSGFPLRCIPFKPYQVRGFTPQEVKTISDALRWNAFQHLNTKKENFKIDSEYILLEGQKLYSTNNNYYATVHGDGNIHVYKNTPNTLIWSLNAFIIKEHGPFSLHLKDDGNMHIIGAAKNDRFLWEAGTSGQGVSPHTLIMQDDGNLVLYDKNRRPIWETKNGQLVGKPFALPQNSMMFSPNGQFFAILQEDGRLVVYQVAKNNEAPKQIWTSTSKVKGNPPYLATILKNGAFFINGSADPKPEQVWSLSTGDKGVPPHTMNLDNLGYLNLIDSKNTVIWSSKGKR